MTETTVEETTAIARVEPYELPVAEIVQRRSQRIEEWTQLVNHELKEDIHYGKIEGAGDRRTLFKSGAEKIGILSGLEPRYDILDKIEQFFGDPEERLFMYEVRCTFVSVETGQAVAQGLGECNSHEEKYRYRTAKLSCPDCGEEYGFMKSRNEPEYFCWTKRGGCGSTFSLQDPRITEQPRGKVINPDPAGQRNTILKMAKIRALRDAALYIGSLSDIFTQDHDDQVPDPAVAAPPNRDNPPPKEAPPPATARVEPSTPAPSNGNAGGGAPATVNPLEFANVGMLMTAAKDHLHLTYQDVRTILEIEQPSEITDYVWAWEALEKAASERQAAFA